MFVQLLLLFILVPLTDLVILLMIARFFSFWVSAGIVVLAGLAGVIIVARQWRQLGSKVQQQIEQNKIPSDLASDSLIVLLAAGLLITPGLLTDLLGVSLLIPRCRKWYRTGILKWLRSRFEIQIHKSRSDKRESWGEVVDGEFRKVDSRDQNQDSSNQFHS